MTKIKLKFRAPNFKSSKLLKTFISTLLSCYCLWQRTLCKYLKSLMRHIVRDHCYFFFSRKCWYLSRWISHSSDTESYSLRNHQSLSLLLKGLYHRRIDCYLKSKKKKGVYNSMWNWKPDWFSNINLYIKIVSLRLNFPFVIHIMHSSSPTLFNMVATSHIWLSTFLNLSKSKNSVFLLY